MIPAEVATKLAKLLPVLSSNQDGEVIGAARAIDRVLKSANLDWHVLADIVSRSAPPPIDLSAFRGFTATALDPDAPDAPARKPGLPIWGVKKVEPWCVVAGHCLDLEWAIPKAFGGKFLTPAERDRLRRVRRYGPVTNAEAAWIENVVARCHEARDRWRSPGQKIAA